MLIKFNFKIKVLITLIILLLSVFCKVCYADAWTKKDTVLEVTWEMLHILDWGQTLDITNNSSYYERNLFLRENPTRKKINTYMSSCAIIHPVISYLLPKKYRNIWQCCSIIVSGTCVANNYNIGLKLNY